jgi:hypothetical protein
MNVSIERPPEDKIPGDTRRAIMEINGLDRQLYEWALQRFDEQLGEMT